MIADMNGIVKANLEKQLVHLVMQKLRLKELKKKKNDQ